jgi:hypothetical protein
MMHKAKLQLIHGGHRGTEAEFGRVAAANEIPEITLSFTGHVMERAENVEMLDDEALEKGRVSMEFVFQRMGRRFVQGKGLRRVMQSMFHLVVRSDELFAIGWIQEDRTVKGGTGWGVELAKLFNRPVHVFDQDKNGWFTWDGMAWIPSEPRLTGRTIGATGTRNLTEHGKRAIRELFEASLARSGQRATETVAR